MAQQVVDKPIKLGGHYNGFGIHGDNGIYPGSAAVLLFLITFGRW
jgi:hypothetical protein